MATESGGSVDALLSDRRSTERVYDGVYYPNFPLTDFFHAAGDPILDPAGYARLTDWDSTDGVPLSEADIEHLRDHYDGGVLAADLQLGRFISELDEQGLLDNTVIILTSDHGEDLHDHGFFNHRAALRDSTTQVPLIIWGSEMTGRREELAEAIDVVPTLLALAGATPPAGLAGRDLLSEAPAPEVIFQEGVLGHLSARTQTHRLVFSGFSLTFPYYDLVLETATAQSGHLALYDLRSDPGEQHNVIAEQPAVAEALRSAMLTWRQGLQRSDFRGQQPDDAALQEILRSRGYW